MRTSGASGQSSSPEAEIFLLDLKKVEHYWKDIEASLDAQPELWDKWFTKESLFERIQTEIIQVWTVCEKDGPIMAVFFTQILIADIGKILQVFWMRGTMPDGAVKCISLALDRFGQHHGCVRLAVIGRKGWERMLRNFGGVVDSISMSRPIEKMTRN